jgi:hypothetical protein
VPHDFPAQQHDRFAIVRDCELRDLIERLDRAQDKLSRLAGWSRSLARIGMIEDVNEAIAEAAACLRQVREGRP